MFTSIYDFDASLILCCRLTGYVKDQAWPCQNIEHAKSVLTRFGVSVTYKEPWLSSEMWHLMLKEQSIPHWEYKTTKQERMSVIPATAEELEYHYSGVYGHNGGT